MSITEKAKALEVAASRAFFVFHFLLQWISNHQVRAALFAVQKIIVEFTTKQEYSVRLTHNRKFPFNAERGGFMRQDTLEGRAKTKNGVIRLCFSVLCILLEAAFIIIDVV